MKRPNQVAGMAGHTMLSWVIPCAISVIGAVSFQSIPRQRNSKQNPLPPAYFNLSAFEDPNRAQRVLEGVEANRPVRLVLNLARSGPAGLRADLEVWNLSEREEKRVPYIDDIDYVLFFRDRSGAAIDVYRIPPLDKIDRPLSAMPLLMPGNHLGATFVIPDFYHRIKKARGVECRASYGPLYLRTDERSDDRVKVQMASEWVPVPSP